MPKIDLDSTPVISATNHRVLLLSSNYEPMRIVSAERAIILDMNSKVDVVHTSDKVFRSPGTTYPLPSVIRYKQYSKRKHRQKLRLSKRNIYLRDQAKGCAYCTRYSPDGFATLAEMTVDHIFPRTQGGGNSWLNLVGCCKRCNERKGGKTPEEAGMPLRYQPHEPTPLMSVLRKNDLDDVPEEWKAYFYF